MWYQRKFGHDQGIYGLVDVPDNGQSAAEQMIVMLPGLAQAMSEKNYLFSNMRKRLAELGAGLIVQFDYRGHGDSHGFLHDATLTNMTADAVEVIDTLLTEWPPRRLMLIGHALGGTVAQQILEHYKHLEGIEIRLILISPLLQRLPRMEEVFEPETLRKLEQEGSMDTQLLVSGFDYYTLQDFDPVQYDYFTRLGCHMLYLHGQCISFSMMRELEQLEPDALFKSGWARKTTVICGERDTETLEHAKHIGAGEIYTLKGVSYFYQSPAAMDELIDCVQGLVTISR